MVGAVGEIIGAIAVVASLAYVGRQVRGNTAAMRSEAFRTLALAGSTLSKDWASDEKFCAAFRSILMDDAGREDFTADERMSISLHFLALTRLQEVAFHQNREGVVGPEILEVIDSATFRTRYFTESWPLYRTEFSTEFVDFMEGRYAKLREADMPGPPQLSPHE
jgi:hypothetical protein